MRRLLLALPLLLAGPIVAQQAMQVPGSKNPAAVTGGTYTVDPEHTLIAWEVDHFGFSPYFGLFGSSTGTLQLDRKNPSASRVDITIPVSKVTTASAGLTEHLLRAPAQPGGQPDFFGANPADARFVSTRVVIEDDDEAKVTGNLTLNGITRPVTLEVEFYGAGKAPAAMGGKENVGFEAETTIKRSEFGITNAIPLVGDEVKLKISAAFVKNGDQPASGDATNPAACGADKAASYVGRQATPAVRKEVASAAGKRMIRWIAPGQAVTMDYRHDRLNVVFDKKGAITEVKCG